MAKSVTKMLHDDNEDANEVSDCDDDSVRRQRSTPDMNGDTK